MPESMHAMQFPATGSTLKPIDLILPDPVEHELIAEVLACGVCRTDVHIADNDIHARRPIVPGHEVVAKVIKRGGAVENFEVGDRVGVPWLGGTCGTCRFCRTGQENLCDHPAFTGFSRDGGFASHVVADARYCLAIPSELDACQAAPLLCAGLIGYRALQMAGDGSIIGLYGFGAAAHLVAQVAVWQGRTVYAFTRPGDNSGQAFAMRQGCAWAGDSDQPPPQHLDAAIIFAPVGSLVPKALQDVRKGGRVVCAGIHMSDIPSFPYSALWGERTVCSVANLTRDDGKAFLDLAAKVPVKAVIRTMPLAQANEALAQIRDGKIEGAIVLVPHS